MVMYGHRKHVFDVPMGLHSRTAVERGKRSVPYSSTMRSSRYRRSHQIFPQQPPIKCTFAAYSHACQKFIHWWGAKQLESVPVAKARNLYLAHCICNSQEISLPMISASLNFFLGKQEDADKEVEKSLLDSAVRNRTPVNHRTKITVEDYNKIVHLGAISRDAKAYSTTALAILLFRGFLRFSEARSLKKEDFTCAGTTFSVFITKSKTDQARRGATASFKIRGASEERVVLNKQMAYAASINSSFLFASQSTKLPLSSSTISKRLQQLFLIAGISHKNYTTHSSRGGAASTALEQGFDSSQVMQMGRWKSLKAFQAYVRPAAVDLDVT
ncbi:site-specific recombinase, phage integrase family [Teladorsagia circumcincta]|uniref:Site-specific recombinase, phage integrase family n=1 Tax=Teladorsagia circumcincta TaxID=45464 RepID=A0A2G9ULL4_TELCI|nr:site-specific recombinase, phage integrase family [Teladorsagia circumcincta]